MNGDQAAHLLALLDDRLPSQRERIATAVMQGILANSNATAYYSRFEFDLARAAVAHADALVAALGGDDA